MPIYEYTCGKCASDFELLVRNGEAATCPECGTTDLERRLSVPAAHTKNGGGGLPICEPAAVDAGGCGRPQCGMGGCQGLM